MIGAAYHISPSLLPLDQQLVAFDLAGRRVLARTIACDESGRATFIVFDPDPLLRDKLDTTEPVGIEYVKVGLCRATFQPIRVDDVVHARAPVLVVNGRLRGIETVQRRDNFRVRLAVPCEIFLLDGSADRPTSMKVDKPIWWSGRSVNASAEGLCIEIRRDLFRGDVISVKLYTEERPVEADARVIGPRPAPDAGNHHYGLQLIQIPRADQTLLHAIIRKEEQRGLAYRSGAYQR